MKDAQEDRQGVRTLRSVQMWPHLARFASIGLSAMSTDDDRSDKEDRRGGSDQEAGALPAPDPTRLWQGEAMNSEGGAEATRVFVSSQETPGVGSSPPPRQLEPGTILFGEYVIEEVLGSGGMGEVYKARHRALGEFRAIKVLHAEISKKKSTAALFLREAKALLSVRHSAVVHCHDLLSDDEGRVFLVMELIEGIPLTDRMAEGPLSMEEVALLGGRLAAGLHAAHEQGVVHRDVSPDNIVLEGSDVARAKLIDFGIAKLLESGPGTVVDGFKGKLSYASPEQLGFSGGRIDGRSDLYSLGLVLCAASLGHPIDMGKTVVGAVDARRNLQSLPDQIPVGLRSALAPLLALDPKDRPERAERLFLAGDPLADRSFHASSASSSGFAAGTPGASLTRIGLGLGLFVLLGLVLYWLAVKGPSSSGGASMSTAASGSVSQGSTPVMGGGAIPAQEAPRPSTAEPSVSEPSALDELKIVGLLRGAGDALAEDRLRRPPGDNAYEKYQAVLGLDPGNEEAQKGLLQVASRYLVLAKGSIQEGDMEKAAHYLGEAVEVAPRHPGVASVQAALATAGQ